MLFSNPLQLKQAFEEVYQGIYRTRFAGLPIANPLLSVQVVGLQETEGFYTFALITPWMLNQVVVPRSEDVDPSALQGMRQDEIETLGTFFVKNVYSPMHQFVCMEDAIEAAEQLAEQLYRAISAPPPDQANGQSRRDFFRKFMP